MLPKFWVRRCAKMCPYVVKIDGFLFCKNREAVFQKQRCAKMCLNRVILGDFVQTYPIVTFCQLRLEKICGHVDYAVVDKLYEFRIESMIGDGRVLCRHRDQTSQSPKCAHTWSKSTILCFAKTGVLFFCFQKNRGAVFLKTEKQRGCFSKTEMCQNVPKQGQFGRFCANKSDRNFFPVEIEENLWPSRLRRCRQAI